MKGPLSRAVADLSIALLPQVSSRTAVGVRGVLQRLDSPLQLAVAGRIKSGKSTLVNALIGRRVAPTDVGECTRLVTRFQYGTVDRFEVVFKDGRRSTMPFTRDGGIPAELPVPLAAVSHLEAYLTSALLADITVIDTPGLGALDEDSTSRTLALLGAPDSGTEHSFGGPGGLDPVSSMAVAGAEAVIYVFTQSVRSDDAAVLSAFTSTIASAATGPVNALAVLNKADTLVPESVEGAAGSVWRAARIVAAEQAILLRPRVADVVPVIGLLAETTETGAFTAADAEALRLLAGMDEDLFRTMIMAADLFTTMKAPVDRPGRVRLVELLDLYGVRRAVEAVRESPGISAGDIRRRLLDDSGLADLRGRLGEVFRSRSDGIKASAALTSMAALAAASSNWAERQRINDAIEVLVQRPESHQLRMLAVLTQLSGGVVQMGELTAEILRLGGSTTPEVRLAMPGAGPAELARVALERAAWWRSFASFGATPAQSRVAHVVHRAYFLLWQELRGRVPPAR